MGTLNEDLSAIKEVEDKIVANKVARFAYTDEAYTTNDANGVAEYDVSKEQNIPTADASVLKVNETVLSKGYRAQASSVTRMLLNHFFGRMSYNLNKVNDIVSNLITTLIGHRGTANGFATLDENGRIPFSQLPESAMTYKGQWNAETNTPTLADGIGAKGDFYIVSVGGTQNLGSGNIQFSANDRVIYDGSVWSRLSAGDVKTVNNISPENGNVALTGENIPVSSTNATLLSAPLTTERIADKAVTTEKIADKAVTNAKIADKAVTTEKIADKAVTNAKIADKAVTTEKIADKAVTNAKIADNAVTTGKIADNAVTNAKIADNAVTTEKIVNNAVTNAKIADNAVTNAKIVNNAVTNAKIADNAVTNAKIKEPISVAKGGTGATGAKNGFINLANGLTESSNPQDTEYMIYKSGTNWGLYALSTFWGYIKDKISSVLGLTENTIATLRTNADQGYLCKLYQLDHAIQTCNVILLGKIPDPASTAVPDTPSSSWDIDVDFYFIRPQGHKAAWCNVKAGYGYSNAWRKYGLIETFGVDVNSSYTNPFFLVTVKYNNEYYIGVRHRCDVDGKYYARVKNVNTNGNGNPSTADGSSLVNMLKVIPYQKVTDDTILNDEIKTSIAYLPDTYAPVVVRNGDLVLESGYVRLGASDVAGSKLIIQGATVNSNSYTDTNPKLEFKNNDGSQNISLTFNDFDSVQSPVSLTLNGNHGNEYFIAPNIKATTNFIGNLTGTATNAYNAYSGEVFTCTTSAATKEKIVSIPRFILATGVCIRVVFDNGNSVARPTLNVNGTGAKEICGPYGELLDAIITSSDIVSGNISASGQGICSWDYNIVLDLYYNGTSWNVIGDPIVIRFSEHSSVNKNISMLGNFQTSILKS